MQNSSKSTKAKWDFLKKNLLDGVVQDDKELKDVEERHQYRKKKVPCDMCSKMISYTNMATHRRAYCVNRKGQNPKFPKTHETKETKPSWVRA